MGLRVEQKLGDARRLLWPANALKKSIAERGSCRGRESTKRRRAVGIAVTSRVGAGAGRCWEILNRIGKTHDQIIDFRIPLKKLT
jgi:hypothetical protein